MRVVQTLLTLTAAIAAVAAVVKRKGGERRNGGSALYMYMYVRECERVVLWVGIVLPYVYMYIR